MAIDGVLLDIDGVLSISWEPLPGAVEALARLRNDRIPFRLITNTTTMTRRVLARTLRDAGFDVADEEVVTAVVATATYLRERTPDARVFVLSDGDVAEDLEGIDLVDVRHADVVVLGGAGERFAYPVINAVFRRLMDGAELVGMHRNLFWKTADGWQLDSGAYLMGLEAAAGTSATVCGKPERTYFASVLSDLGVAAERAAMVGDDVQADVLGAQAAGMTGILVRTGKYREGDETKHEGRPDQVVDSIADVPALVSSR
jgi:HAD superfamily hydrolase (TIGR01458 family)